MSVLPAHVYVYHVHARCPLRPEKDVESPGTGGRVDCEVPWGHWELNRESAVNHWASLQLLATFERPLSCSACGATALVTADWDSWGKREKGQSDLRKWTQMSPEHLMGVSHKTKVTSGNSQIGTTKKQKFLLAYRNVRKLKQTKTARLRGTCATLSKIAEVLRILRVKKGLGDDAMSWKHPSERGQLDLNLQTSGRSPIHAVLVTVRLLWLNTWQEAKRRRVQFLWLLLPLSSSAQGMVPLTFKACLLS